MQEQQHQQRHQQQPHQQQRHQQQQQWGPRRERGRGREGRSDNALEVFASIDDLELSTPVESPRQHRHDARDLVAGAAGGGIRSSVPAPSNHRGGDEGPYRHHAHVPRNPPRGGGGGGSGDGARAGAAAAGVHNGQSVGGGGEQRSLTPAPGGGGVRHHTRRRRQSSGDLDLLVTSAPAPPQRPRHAPHEMPYVRHPHDHLDHRHRDRNPRGGFTGDEEDEEEEVEEDVDRNSAEDGSAAVEVDTERDEAHEEEEDDEDEEDGHEGGEGGRDDNVEVEEEEDFDFFVPDTERRRDGGLAAGGEGLEAGGSLAGASHAATSAVAEAAVAPPSGEASWRFEALTQEMSDLRRHVASLSYYIEANVTPSPSRPPPPSTHEVPAGFRNRHAGSRSGGGGSARSGLRTQGGTHGTISLDTEDSGYEDTWWGAGGAGPGQRSHHRARASVRRRRELTPPPSLRPDSAIDWEHSEHLHGGGGHVSELPSLVSTYILSPGGEEDSSDGVIGSGGGESTSNPRRQPSSARPTPASAASPRAVSAPALPRHGNSDARLWGNALDQMEQLRGTVDAMHGHPQLRGRAAWIRGMIDTYTEEVHSDTGEQRQYGGGETHGRRGEEVDRHSRDDAPARRQRRQSRQGGGRRAGVFSTQVPLQSSAPHLAFFHQSLARGQPERSSGGARAGSHAASGSGASGGGQPRILRATLARDDTADERDEAQDADEPPPAASRRIHRF